MNLLDKIRSWLPGQATEKRMINGEQNWIVNPTLGGVIVNEDTAPTFAAVYAAINILASDVSAFPFEVVKRGKDNERSIDYSHPIHDLISSEPNEELSMIGLKGSMMWHLCTKGNALAEIERERQTLRPVAIHLLDPDKVQVKRTSDRQLFYDIQGDRFLPRDIIHVAAVGRDGLVGRSPIQQCREEIGLGMATVKFGAARFGNGIQECGVIEIPQTLDEVQTKSFRAGINREHQGPYNSHKLLLLQGGAKFSRTSITAEDAQFLGTRKFNLEEVARIFRIPPTKLMSFDRATFNNIEETNLDYYLSSLLPWLRRFEAEFNRKLFTREERRVWTIEHDETFTLRGRIADQANVDKIYRDMGVLSTDEIRARRGWCKVAGGHVRFVPLNMAPLEAVANATLAELKGVKADPISDAPKAPATESPSSPDASDEVDTPILVADGDVVDAVRSVVRDTAQRMVRREAKALRNLAKRNDLAELVDGLEALYGREADTLIEAYSQPLRALSFVTRHPIKTPELVASMVESSRAEIRACLEGPGTAAALGALADRWDADKASDILSRIDSEVRNSP